MVGGELVGERLEIAACMHMYDIYGASMGLVSIIRPSYGQGRFKVLPSYTGGLKSTRFPTAFDPL